MKTFEEEEEEEHLSALLYVKVTKKWLRILQICATAKRNANKDLIIRI